MKKTDKKSVILDVSRIIFSKHGLLKTTVGEIAKAARMGKASLYHYFDSKEDIYRVVVENEYNFLTKLLKEAIDKVDNPQEKMEIYFVKKLQNLTNLANIHTALKDELLEHYAFIEKIRVKNNDEELNTIKDILKKGVDDGIFELAEIDITAFAIISAMKGLEYNVAINVSEKEIQTYINILLNILFNGIVKK